MAEIPSNRTPEKSWSVDAPYDLARRREIIEQEGSDSWRVANMDTYIDFINNDMPPTYMAITEIIKIPLYYEPYTKPPKIEPAQIYKLNKQGEFAPHKLVDDLYFFVGRKIVLQEEEVFVANAEYAVKPIDSVKMINVDPIEDERGSNLRSNCERLLAKMRYSSTWLWH